MALPSGSPMVRGEPTGTRGKAGRHCAASRARRSSSTSYNEAIARKAVTPQGTLAIAVAGLSGAAQNLAGSPSARGATMSSYIKGIEKELGDFPLSALTDRRTRGIFMAWRDKLAAKSRRQADYAWSRARSGLVVES